MDMKLNCENYLKYLSNEHKTQFIILRFPNVIGPNLTHGVIFDFLKKSHSLKVAFFVFKNLHHLKQNHNFFLEFYLHFFMTLNLNKSNTY